MCEEDRDLGSFILRGCMWCHMVSLGGLASVLSQKQVSTRLGNWTKSIRVFSLKFCDLMYRIMKRFKNLKMIKTSLACYFLDRFSEPSF